MIRDLLFKIRAKDETGAAFGSVKGKLGEVEGALGGVGAAGRRELGGLKAAGLAAAAGIGVSLAALGRDSLQLFDVQAKAQAQVETAVRSTGGAAGFSAGELFKMASALQEVTTFGDEAILADVTGQLLTFTNIQGQVFDRAQRAALDLSTALGSDLRSQAIQLGKALNDPIAGIGALAEAGIQFSEDQKGVIKRLVETGRVAEAQGLILDELAIQFGGQAAAAAEAGLGPVTQLSNSIGDLKEEIGRELLPLIRPVIDFTRDAVAAFAALPGPVKQTAVAVGALAAAIAPVVAVVGVLSFALGAISTPVLAVGAAIGGVVAVAFAFREELAGVVAGIYDFVRAAGIALGIVDRTEGELRARRAALAESLASLSEVTVAETGAADQVATIRAEIAGLDSQIAEIEKRKEAARTPAAALPAGAPVRTAAGEGTITAAARKEVSEFDRLIASSRARINDLATQAALVGVAGEEAARLGERLRLVDAAAASGVTINRDKLRQIEEVSILYGEQATRLEALTAAQALLTEEERIGGTAAERLAGERERLRALLPALTELTGDQAKAEEILGRAVERAAERVQSGFEGFAGEVADSIAEIARSGEITFRGFADALVGIGRNLANRLLETAFRPLETGLAAILNAGLGGLATGGAGGGGLGALFASILPFADGGVVNGATLFAHSGGLGVAGEAGPEAILPLRRGADGRLGVVAAGGGGALTINVDARGAGDPAAVSAAVRIAVAEALRRVPGVNRDMRRRGQI